MAAAGLVQISSLPLARRDRFISISGKNIYNLPVRRSRTPVDPYTHFA
jgi:hypothetical protein